MHFKLNCRYFNQSFFPAFRITISYKKTHKSARNAGGLQVISGTFRLTEKNIPAVN